MKRILITGKSSYVGNKLEEWLNQSEEEYAITKVSVRDNHWKTLDFSQYDTVLHLAGIAHVSRDPKMEDQYYKVNRDLTIQIAEKAKTDGVSQFIFMSSIIVYGEFQEYIDQDTVPKPDNFYGNSKLQAEEGIQNLASETFRISIIRPPMIYGEGAKGNYNKLSKLAKITPIFPDIENKRSMIHIDNLSEFIKQLIDFDTHGLFFPQNKEFIKTSQMVELISEVNNSKILLTKWFNPIIKPLTPKLGTLNKVFGNLYYDQRLSNYNFNYHVRNLKESIHETEGGKSIE